jgi:VWFA-related protein
MKALLLAALFAFAQQPEPTIRVNVNLIQVDATVTDRAGRHVPDLKAADFEVFREGKRQQIKSVLWVPGQRTGIAPTATDQAPATSRAAAGNLRPEDVRRTVAIMLDDRSLSLGSMHFVRTALKTFVEKNVDSRDLVAIYRTSSGLGLMQQFSTNKRQLLSYIDRLRHASLRAFDPLAPLSNSPLESSSDPTIAQQALEQAMREDAFNREQQDMQTAGMLGAVNLAVRGLRELPGRKALVLVSESVQLYDVPPAFNNPDLPTMGPGADGGKRRRTEAAVRSLIDVANRAGVMIYSIDPRGVVYPGLTAQDDVSSAPSLQRINGMIAQRGTDLTLSQDGMGLLAEQTGGVFYRNTNDLAGSMAKALDDQEGYYLIAFAPDDDTFEKAKGTPKFQRLNVKVKRSGLSVRYRHGFYGVPDREDTPANPLVSAVLSPFRNTQIPLKLTPVFMRDANAVPLLRTLLHIDVSAMRFSEVPAAKTDPNQQPWQQAVVNEVVLLFDENGKLIDHLAQPQTIRARGDALEHLRKHGVEQQLDVPVPRPGPYQVRAAVLDHASQQTGSAAQFVEVPDLKTKRLALSSLVISSAEWSQNRDPAGSASQRIVRPGGELDYALFIYNTTPAKTGPQANLLTQLRLFRDGNLIYTSPKNPMRPEGLTDLQSLTLRGKMRVGADPGDYLLEVAVQDLSAPAKQQFAVRAIDFTVSPIE